MQKEFLIEVAKEAWRMMRETSWREVSVKDGGEIVTDVDKAINKMVIQRISETYPTHTIHGEEQNWGVWESEFTRITDPIDGTIPFSRWIWTACFSLALLQDGVPILGCVYQPYLDEMYLAQKWWWATCNGRKISVSTRTLKDKRFLFWWNAWLNEPYNMKKVTDHLYQSDKVILDLGTITYMWCLIARWAMDALIFPNLKPYDLAAVKVIVEEAWGKETDLFWDEQRFDLPIKGNLVTNWHCHDEFLEIIDAYIHKK